MCSCAIAYLKKLMFSLSHALFLRHSLFEEAYVQLVACLAPRHSLFEEAYVQLVACLQGGLFGEAGRLIKALALFFQPAWFSTASILHSVERKCKIPKLIC